MKNKILKVLNTKKDVSFVELAREVEGFCGESDMSQFVNQNVVFWGKMSSEAISAISQLRSENLIRFDHTSKNIYSIDGLTLDLPLCEGPDPKEMSWLPVVINMANARVHVPFMW